MDAPDLLIAGSSTLAAALFRRAGELGLRTLWLDEDPEDSARPLELLLSGAPERLSRDPALCALRAAALDGLLRRHAPLLRRRGLLLPLHGADARADWRAYDLFAPLRRCPAGRLLSPEELLRLRGAQPQETGGGFLRWEEWGAEPGTLARRWTEEGATLGGRRVAGARPFAFTRARGRIMEVRWSTPDGRDARAHPAVVVNAAGARAGALAERARCRLFGVSVRTEHWLLLRAAPGTDAVLLDTRAPLFLLPCAQGAWLGPLAGPPHSRESGAPALAALRALFPALGDPGPGAPLAADRACVRGTFLRAHGRDDAENLLTALAEDPLLEWAAAERAAAAALELLGRSPPAAGTRIPLWVRLLAVSGPAVSRAAALLFRTRGRITL